MRREDLISEGNLSQIYKISSQEIIQVFESRNLEHFHRERLLRTKISENQIRGAESNILLGFEYSIEKRSLNRFFRRVKVCDPEPLLRFLERNPNESERLEIVKQIVQRLKFYHNILGEEYSDLGINNIFVDRNRKVWLMRVHQEFKTQKGTNNFYSNQ